MPDAAQDDRLAHARPEAWNGWLGLPAHRAWLAAETGRLLDFAAASAVPGGFAALDDDGVPDASEPLQLLIATRMTHVFSLGHLLGRPGSGPLADHGVAALRDGFRDPEHDGWWSALTRDGRPAATEKQAYDHAFVVLAASSASLAGRSGADDLLADALAVVEERFWSAGEQMSVESWDAPWRALDGYRGANANMHMTEAFLAAGDATGDRVWHDRALRIAERLIDGTARAHGWRVPEHYDDAWRPRPDYNRSEPRHQFRPYGVTPGHGLEWSRLLLHLRASLGDPPGWLLDAARALFERALADGRQPGGGIVYTTDHDGRPVVADRLHWVIAEAIGAAAALHHATGEDAYERWYRTLWDYAALHLLDRERGSWHHELDEHDRPSAGMWQGKPDAYHAVQATLIPRLPLAPGMAAALRQGLLDRG